MEPDRSVTLSPRSAVYLPVNWACERVSRVLQIRPAIGETGAFMPSETPGEPARISA